MREKLKQFIKQRGLTIVFLHKKTGIHTTTLSKFIKTDLPVNKQTVDKLAEALKDHGFITVDFEGLVKILRSNGFSVIGYDYEHYSISSYDCEDEASFNPKLLESITYSEQETGWLFCETKFSNGTKILFHTRNFKVKLS